MGNLIHIGLHKDSLSFLQFKISPNPIWLIYIIKFEYFRVHVSTCLLLTPEGTFIIFSQSSSFVVSYPFTSILLFCFSFTLFFFFFCPIHWLKPSLVINKLNGNKCVYSENVEGNWIGKLESCQKGNRKCSGDIGQVSGAERRGKLL